MVEWYNNHCCINITNIYIITFYCIILIERVYFIIIPGSNVIKQSI